TASDFSSSGTKRLNWRYPLISKRAAGRISSLIRQSRRQRATAPSSRSGSGRAVVSLTDASVRSQRHPSQAVQTALINRRFGRAIPELVLADKPEGRHNSLTFVAAARVLV